MARIEPRLSGDLLDPIICQVGDYSDEIAHKKTIRGAGLVSDKCPKWGKDYRLVSVET